MPCFHHPLPLVLAHKPQDFFDPCLSFHSALAAKCQNIFPSESLDIIPSPPLDSGHSPQGVKQEVAGHTHRPSWRGRAKAQPCCLSVFGLFVLPAGFLRATCLPRALLGAD